MEQEGRGMHANAWRFQGIRTTLHLRSGSDDDGY
jgi:hypothetical protein